MFNVALILGNGPSLNGSINEIHSIKNKVDVFGVNFFCISPIFAQIEPRYYVINAPELTFINESKLPKTTIESKNKLFEKLLQVHWEMTLFVPYRAIESTKRKLAKNRFIHVQGFNPTPLEGTRFFMNFALNKGWGLPRPHNVLIPALALSIRMGYAKSLLLGAEHSWIQTISVTQENEVLIDHQHFYDGGKQMGNMNSSQFKPRKLHEILQKFYYSFKSYWELKYFAQHLDTEVLNVTPNSYIDAFKKVDLSDVQL